MCNRYSIIKPGQIKKAFNVQLSLLPPQRARYNISLTDPVPVVTYEEEQRVLHQHRWGMNLGKNMAFNIRDDKIAASDSKKPFFRDLLLNQHCLMPADGFFEYYGPKGNKQAVYFRLKSHDFFAFAALRRADQAEPHTMGAALITTNPNDLMTKYYHDRMPVIIDREHVAAWLDPEADVITLLEMLRSYESDAMEGYMVSKLANKVGNEGPDVIKPLEVLQPSLIEP